MSSMTCREYKAELILFFSQLVQPQRGGSRVVRGDINFETLRDPLDFLFLLDPYGPYLIEFSFENGSFLLTKAPGQSNPR